MNKEYVIANPKLAEYVSELFEDERQYKDALARACKVSLNNNLCVLTLIANRSVGGAKVSVAVDIDVREIAVIMDGWVPVKVEPDEYGTYYVRNALGTKFGLAVWAPVDDWLQSDLGTDFAYYKPIDRDALLNLLKDGKL